jgi:GTPase
LQRNQSRRARIKADISTVSIVGYTNAGKSTLFNTLTSSSVYTADQLFATLDPMLRSISLPSIGKIIVADTVGFIRHLPHDLVDAFKATLEETQKADLLLHVVDAHQYNRENLIFEVNHVLKEIEASHIPQLLVFNKIDLFDNVPSHIDRDERGNPKTVWVSAITGEGMTLLQEALLELLGQNIITQTLKLNPMQGKLRAELYTLQRVIEEQELEDGWKLTVRMPKKEFDRLVKQLKS